MKKLFIFVCLAGFLATLNLSAFAEEELGLDISLKYWHTSGEMKFRTSLAPLVASELVFPQDGNIGILSVEYGTWRKFFVNASVGIGSNSGTSSDSDWIPIRTLVSVSTQDCSSEPLLWDINLGYRLLDKPELNAEPTFDIFVGYQHEGSEFKMTNLYQTVTSPGFPPVGPIPGLNSTYEITYRGPRIGIKGNFKPASRWTLEGSFAYAWLTTKGKGYWNLRNFSFIHSGGNGEGIDTKVGVGYTFARIPALSLQLDYRYLKMENKGGTGQGGTKWDYAKSTFQGPMFLVAYKW